MESESDRLERLIIDGGPITPADFPPQHNGQRFQVRVLNGRWQVYGLGLVHVCLCATEPLANMVAEALEICHEDKPGVVTTDYLSEQFRAIVG